MLLQIKTIEHCSLSLKLVVFGALDSETPKQTVVHYKDSAFFMVLFSQLIPRGQVFAPFFHTCRVATSTLPTRPASDCECCVTFWPQWFNCWRENVPARRLLCLSRVEYQERHPLLLQ